MNIGFISCSKSKKAGIHPAEDVYDSTLFRFSLTFAKKQYEKVYIISAKHGLLTLEQKIKDYDLTLNNMSLADRRKWAHKVIYQIQSVVSSKDSLHFLCGKSYWGHIVPEISTSYACHTPLKGLSIGRQLQWYKQNTPLA